MTLTKTDIVRGVMENVRFKNSRKGPQIFLFPEMNCRFLTRGQASKIVNTLFDTIKKTLANGEDVHIHNFGGFRTRFKWARKGRNPQTGEMIILRSRRTVRFRPARKLKKKMNM